MRPFRSVTGVAVPFGMKNVDTDIIIPAKWLKTISRSGLGKGTFEALRASPGNIFDTPRNAGAPILIAGENFGCGSSREHAPWALIDMGFRVIIAPGFADIFSGNSAKNGLLLVSLPQDAVDRLMEIAPQVELTVDLERQLVTSPLHDRFSFEIDPFRRHCLLEGLDEIGITETMADDITRYEQRLRQNRAWIFAQ